MKTPNFFKNGEYILNAQGMDFVPSSIELTGIENILINTMSRENVLKKFIGYIKEAYWRAVLASRSV